MVLLYDEHLGDNIIAGDIYISRIIVTERRDLELSYIHIGLHTDDAKYRI